MIDYFQKDFADDFWLWSKVYEEFKNHIPFTNDPQLDHLQQKIIIDQNAAFAFFCAYYFNYRSHLMQKVIIDTQNVKYAYAFSKFVRNADIKALQEIVLQSHKIKYICWFGTINGSDRRKIEKIIIQSNKAQYAYAWLKQGKVYHFDQIKDILIRSQKPQYLLEIAKRVKSKKELRQLENLIIESGSLNYIRLFAQLPNANIKRLEQVILDSGNAAMIKKFALTVKGSKLKNFVILL